MGDPPLFLGFLKGVSFFWTTTHLFLKTLCLSVALLAIFFVLDTVLFNKEGRPTPPHDPNAAEEKLGLDGKINLLFLLGVVLAVLASGMLPLGTWIEVFGVPVEGQNLLRDIVLLCLAGLSWKFTSRRCRELNGFSWAPIEEVAKLFFGIFLSMIPAIAILRAGTDGALSSLIQMVSTPDGQPVNAMYFWLTGALSSFLDNAPTYLVFFNTAGGDAVHLMNDMANTLIGLSRRARCSWAPSISATRPTSWSAPSPKTRRAHAQLLRLHGLSVGTLIPLFALLTRIFFIWSRRFYQFKNGRPQACRFFCLLPARDRRTTHELQGTHAGGSALQGMAGRAERRTPGLPGKIFRYNHLPPDREGERDALLREILGACGRHLRIEGPFYCDYGYNIVVGENFFANYNFTVLDVARVSIGRCAAMIAPNVAIYRSGTLHPVSLNRANTAGSLPPSAHVWIGGNTVINPGVRVGDNAIGSWQRGDQGHSGHTCCRGPRRNN